MASLFRIAARFPGRRVLVAGDPILDTFISGDATRLCSEGPVPVIVKRGERDLPGGAANVAANVAALGGDVALAGIVGRDQAAGRLRATLIGAEVEPAALVEDLGRATAHKVRLLAGSHYVARFDQEPDAEVSAGAEAALGRRLEAEAERAEAVVVSDYGKGTMTARAAGRLREVCRERRLPVLLDAKDLRGHRGLAPTLVTPNLAEARQLAGDGDDAARAAEAVLEATGAEWALVTMSGRGALLAGRSGGRVELPAWPAHAVAEVGAGDSLVAAAALALASGARVEEAARIGMAAAAAAVAKPGTAVVTPGELAARLGPVSMGDDRRDALTAQRLAELLEPERRAGRRVVFTNGVFDLLHPGHVAFLERAHRLGDVLVVGVNSDAGAHRIKGEGRPVQGEQERLTVVGGLAAVSHALLFDSDTADTVVRVLRPDVYVKGEGRDVDQIPEVAAAEAVGAEMVVLPRLAGFSTSALIGRVQERQHAAG